MEVSEMGKMNRHDCFDCSCAVLGFVVSCFDVSCAENLYFPPLRPS